MSYWHFKLDWPKSAFITPQGYSSFLTLNLRTIIHTVMELKIKESYLLPFLLESSLLIPITCSCTCKYFLSSLSLFHPCPFSYLFLPSGLLKASCQSPYHQILPAKSMIYASQHPINEDYGIWSHHFMANRWEQWQILFLEAPKSLQMVTAAMKLKDTCSLEEKLWPT